MSIIIELDSYLNADALIEVIEGRAIAVRVANFCESRVCDAIADRMMTSKHFGKYANAPRIGRVGRAFYESVGAPASVNVYFNNALHWMREIREECAPFCGPIDKLRLQLDEAWPGSCRVARLAGRPMFAGLLRIFEEGSGAEPHQDVLDWDAAAVEIYEGAFLQAQLAVNCYLRVPEKGGELVIWPRTLTRQEYDERRIPGSYGVQEHLIGVEPVVLMPRRAELIVFNSRMVHAVRAPDSGSRITWSAFLGYTSRPQPLSVWS